MFFTTIKKKRISGFQTRASVRWSPWVWGSHSQFPGFMLQCPGSDGVPTKLRQNRGQFAPLLGALQWLLAHTGSGLNLIAGCSGLSMIWRAPSKSACEGRDPVGRLCLPHLSHMVSKNRGMKWTSFLYVSLLKINPYLVEADRHWLKIKVSEKAAPLLSAPHLQHPPPLSWRALVVFNKGERPTLKFPVFHPRCEAERE